MSTKISIADITSISGYAATNNKNSCIFYDLGNARSGEGYNSQSCVFRQPGLISLPVGPGAFDAMGQYTQSQFSQTAAQAIVVENSSRWFVIGMRDTRNQNLLPATNIGETRLFAEINPNTFLYLDKDGNVEINTTTNNLASVAITTNTINLGAEHPTDKVALASKTNQNFNKISNAANIAATSASAISANPPTTLAQALLDITALANIIKTFCNSLTFVPVDSTIVNISS